MSLHVPVCEGSLGTSEKALRSDPYAGPVRRTRAPKASSSLVGLRSHPTGEGFLLECDHLMRGILSLVDLSTRNVAILSIIATATLGS